MQTRGSSGAMEAWMTLVAIRPPRTKPDWAVTSQSGGLSLAKTEATEAVSTTLAHLLVNQDRFHGKTRTKSEGDAGPWCSERAQSFKDEKQCRRGHVATIGENLPRCLEGVGGQTECYFHRRQNLGPARVHSPRMNALHGQSVSAQPILHPGSEMRR